MMKFLLFVVIGLLGATLVRAYIGGAPNSCGLHGDSCGLGCCDGFQCNAKANRCMATITVEMLEEARDKLKHVELKPRSFRRTCGLHGDSCDHGCCVGHFCNSYAEKCMAVISPESLDRALTGLNHVKTRHVREASCGKHGDACSQGCCDGFSCNAYAGKCMARITAEMLQEARSKLKHVEKRPPRQACGKHGDSCSEGCCDGFFCNDYAGKCMARVTGEMLEEAHAKLKHVEPRPPRQAVCGKHGDSCADGCCDGFFCNDYAGKCMARVTAEMLEEARSKLKHVEPRPPRQSVCGKHGDSCDGGCCDGFTCNRFAERCMASITPTLLSNTHSKLKPVPKPNEESSPPNAA